MNANVFSQILEKLLLITMKCCDLPLYVLFCSFENQETQNLQIGYSCEWVSGGYYLWAAHLSAFTSG